MSNYVPLIINPGSAQIQELPAGDNINLANSNIANVVDITATGNVTAAYFIGDGSQLTNVSSGSNYANANVVNYAESGWVGNIIPSGNGVYSLGNSTNWWSNVWLTGNTLYIGGVPVGVSGNVLTVDGNAVLSNDSNTSISTTGNISADVGLFNDINLNNAATNKLLYTDEYRNIYDTSFSFYSGNNAISGTGNITAGYFIGDGSQLTNLPGGGNTGNVTFSDQIVIGTGNPEGGSGLYLAPGTDSTGNLQYLRVRGGDYVTHIHLDTGNNQYFDQYFGDDNKYVKLEATGNVVISADNGANSESWTFGTGGDLTVPGGILGGGNLKLSPDSANTGSYLDIFLTSGPDLHLVASASANLILGKDDGANIMTSWNGNAYIQSWNQNTGNIGGIWTFSGDGSTIFPTLNVARGDTTSGNISGYTLKLGNGSQEAIITTPDGDADGNPNSERIVINPGKGADTTSGEGGDIYLWAGRGGDVGGSGGDVKIRGGQGMVNGAGGYIRMEGGDGQGVGQAGYITMDGGSAVDNTGGYLQFRGGYSQNNDGGYIQIQGGYSTNGEGGDVNIIGGGSDGGQGLFGNIGMQSGNRTWTFDNIGNLTLPGNTFAVNYANGTQVPLYGDANVATFLAGYGSNTISTTGNITADNFIGSGPNVELVAGSYTWNFDESGTLTIPGGGLIDTNVNGGIQLIAGSNGTVRLSSNNENNFWIFDSDGRTLLPLTTVNGNTAAWIAANGNLTIDANGNYWNFHENGDITVPGNLTAYSGASPAPSLNGFSSLSAYDSINVGSIGISSNGQITSNTATFSGNISASGNIQTSGFMQCAVYTAANLTAITGSIGQLAVVSDSGGGGNPNGMLAFWDTTNNRWSYVHDNGAV